VLVGEAPGGVPEGERFDPGVADDPGGLRVNLIEVEL
jgi:hypothetical protein